MTTAELSGRVAVVTGANHGIGAATAALLAGRSAAVVAAYLRFENSGDHPGTPETYGEVRARTADDVVPDIRTAGGAAVALEADLSDPTTPARIFDAAEAEFGPVEINSYPAKASRGLRQAARA